MNQVLTNIAESNVSKEVLDFIMRGTVSGMSDNQHNVTTDLIQNSDERIRTKLVSARYSINVVQNFR